VAFLTFSKTAIQNGRIKNVDLQMGSSSMSLNQEGKNNVFKSRGCEKTTVQNKALLSRANNKVKQPHLNHCSSLSEQPTLFDTERTANFAQCKKITFTSAATKTENDIKN